MIHIGGRLLGLFFFLMLVIPTTLQPERGALLALLLLGTILILILLPRRWCVSKPLFIWLVICVTYSLFSILWGIINDASGAISVSTVYVFWPILYVYFSGFCRSIKYYIFLIKILLIGVFIAAVSGVLFVASFFYQTIGILDPYFELMGGSIGLYENSIAYNLNNMATVIYGLPFLVALLLVNKHNFSCFSRNWKVFCVINFVTCIFVMLVSGRRAFIVVGLISVPFAVVLMHVAGIYKLQARSTVKFIGAAFGVVALTIFIGRAAFGFDISVLMDYFVSGFNFDDLNNLSASRRAEQFLALIGEWKSSPFIGFGHGSNAIASPGDIIPWAYELQYIALLFQTGIFGMLVYGSAVIWLMSQMFRLSRKYEDISVLMLPTLVGLICFLIANATNPYLSKFDYLWILFLPVGLVNIGMLRDRALPELNGRELSYVEG